MSKHVKNLNCLYWLNLMRSKAVPFCKFHAAGKVRTCLNWSSSFGRVAHVLLQMLLIQLKQMKLISAWVLFESTGVDDIATLCNIYTYMCPFLDIASIVSISCVFDPSFEEQLYALKGARLSAISRCDRFRLRCRANKKFENDHGYVMRCGRSSWVTSTPLKN